MLVRWLVTSTPPRALQAFIEVETILLCASARGGLLKIRKPREVTLPSFSFHRNGCECRTGDGEQWNEGWRNCSKMNEEIKWNFDGATCCAVRTDGRLRRVQAGHQKDGLIRERWPSDCDGVGYDCGILHDLNRRSLRFCKIIMTPCVGRGDFVASPCTIISYYLALQVRTRLMNQPVGGPKLYNSFADCFLKASLFSLFKMDI